MMRKFLILFFAIVSPCSISLADDIEYEAPGTFSGGFVPGLLCEDCRDPYDYPMDYVAFGYNAFFGEDPWLFGSEVNWPFRVYNLEREWVNIWFDDVFHFWPSLLPEVLTVMIRFENGRIFRFYVLRDEPSLPVGEQQPEPESESTACGCAGGDDDDDEYTEPEEELEFEERERTGSVEIVDPDEDGDFPPFWEEEL
jgi:hypothetical protein